MPLTRKKYRLIVLAAGVLWLFLAADAYIALTIYKYYFRNHSQTIGYVWLAFTSLAAAALLVEGAFLLIGRKFSGVG